ncbi:MAG: hypothetical protein ACOC7V_12310 [Spirochaetota bacterium]
MNRETLQQVVHGIIHEGKQIPETDDVVVLTAKRIGRLTHNGTLDFGGSEYTEAPIEWTGPSAMACRSRCRLSATRESPLRRRSASEQPASG